MKRKKYRERSRMTTIKGNLTEKRKVDEQLLFSWSMNTYGARCNSSSEGGSVANARAAKESMIKFTQSSLVEKRNVKINNRHNTHTNSKRIRIESNPNFFHKGEKKKSKSKKRKRRTGLRTGQESKEIPLAEQLWSKT